MTRARRKLRERRQYEGHQGELQPMTVRKPSVLLAIREQYGSAVLAALNGAVNAEEYLKLEALSEH